MRALQGVAGALLVPSSLALITATFPGDERGAAIGSWTAWTGMAFVIGPLGGGALIEFVSWRWIFAINVPLVLVTLWFVRAGVPESRDEEAPRQDRLPRRGARLARARRAGVRADRAADVRLERSAGVGARAGRAWRCSRVFLWHERRTDHPMLPLSLFRSRNFAVGNAATLLIYGGLGAATFYVTIFLQQVAGWGAIEAGLSLVPITLCMWVLSRRFGALSDRIGPRLLMGLGPIVAGIGLIWMGRLDADVNYWTELLPGVLVFGVGLSATVAPLTNTVLGAVPQHNAGVASGVNNQIARVASLLAIAAVGAGRRRELRVGARPEPTASTRCRAARPRWSTRRSTAYRTGLGIGGRAGRARRRALADRDRRTRGARSGRGGRAATSSAPVRLAQPCPEGRRAA